MSQQRMDLLITCCEEEIITNLSGVYMFLNRKHLMGSINPILFISFVMTVSIIFPDFVLLQKCVVRQYFYASLFISTKEVTR